MTKIEANDVIEACAIARDLESFSQLIEDLEARLGTKWGGLDFNNAEDILQSSHADALQFVVIALDKTDEDELTPAAKVIAAAKERDIKVILVTQDLSAIALHQLMRLGADDFVPYPIPENALSESIDRVLTVPEEKIIIKEVFLSSDAAHAQAKPAKQGILLPVYGLSGGVGATTFSTNLAWEMQTILSKKDKCVCIMDFDFQFGSVATYLDVAKSEVAFELISEPSNADAEAVQRQTIRKVGITKDNLDEAMKHLIIPDGLLDQIGPAVNSGKSILMYGPPGNGKSSIANGIRSAMGDRIYMPRVLEYAGQVISVYDPIIHNRIEIEDSDLTGLRRMGGNFDQRYVQCERPSVITGGELTLDMLELKYNPNSKTYQAPLQLKAAGGVFIVDDLGRQKETPQALINRWIVPMEGGEDILSLQSGEKFTSNSNYGKLSLVDAFYLLFWQSDLKLARLY